MNKHKFLKSLIALFAVGLLVISCNKKPTSPEGDIQIINDQQGSETSLPEVIKNLGTKTVDTVDGAKVSILFTSAKGTGNNYTVSVTANKVEAITKAELEKVLSSATVELEGEKAKVKLDGNVVVTIDGGTKVFFVENCVSVGDLQNIINDLGTVTVEDSNKSTFSFTFSIAKTPVSRLNAKEFTLNNGNIIIADSDENPVAPASIDKNHVVYKFFTSLTHKVGASQNLNKIGTDKTRQKSCFIKAEEVNGKIINDLEIIFNTTTPGQPTYTKCDVRIQFSVELGDTIFGA